jgi:hypothetical protein
MGALTGIGLGTIGGRGLGAYYGHSPTEDKELAAKRRRNMAIGAGAGSLALGVPGALLRRGARKAVSMAMPEVMGAVSEIAQDLGVPAETARRVAVRGYESLGPSALPLREAALGGSLGGIAGLLATKKSEQSKG